MLFVTQIVAQISLWRVIIIDNQTDEPVYSSHLLEVRSSDGYAGVFAKRLIPKDEVLLPLRGNIVSLPTKYSLQISRSEHIIPPMQEDHPRIDECTWCFINHSCHPNVYVDVQGFNFVAWNEIEEGQSLSFNYNTTEWDMSSPFRCECGSWNCYGYVQGFKYLSNEQRRELLPLTAPHIKNLYEKIYVAAE